MTNICIHISCGSLENHTQFQTKNMDKFYTVFRLKQGGIYLYCFYKRVPPGTSTPIHTAHCRAEQQNQDVPSPSTVGNLWLFLKRFLLCRVYYMYELFIIEVLKTMVKTVLYYLTNMNSLLAQKTVCVKIGYNNIRALHGFKTGKI